MRAVRPALLAAVVAVACVAHAQPRKSGAATPPARVTSIDGDIAVERLAPLEFPWGLGVLPDGRVLVTEKPGRLRIWANGRLSEPLTGLPKAYYRGPKDQGGLMDVEVDPDFARNQTIYVSYFEAAEQQPGMVRDTGDVRFGNFLELDDSIVRGGAVASARLVGNALQDVKVIWRQTPKAIGRGHFGNRLLFGRDGMLYITSGERMRFDPAQQADSNLGKVLRLARDGSVPRDNPGNGSGVAGQVWSTGHRNILAAAFDPANGNLWAFEMGPKGGDEVNLVKRGKNYGWPLVSNGDNYAGPMIPDHPTKPEFEAPVRTWTPVVSPSGAMFYTGDLFTAWRGHALVGGLSTKGIVRLRFNGDRIVDEERIDLQARIRDLAQLPDGSILALVDDRAGAMVRLSPAGSRAASR